MDTEGIGALLGILPFAYLLSLPPYWVLHKLLQKFAGLDAGFWKLSAIAVIAVIPAALLAVLAWGGDGTPPPVATALLYILLGAAAFAIIFWLGAKLFGTTISATGAGLALAYSFVLFLLAVFMTRSGS